MVREGDTKDRCCLITSQFSPASDQLLYVSISTFLLVCLHPSFLSTQTSTHNTSVRYYYFIIIYKLLNILEFYFLPHPIYWVSHSFLDKAIMAAAHRLTGTGPKGKAEATTQYSSNLSINFQSSPDKMKNRASILCSTKYWKHNVIGAPSQLRCFLCSPSRHQITVDWCWLMMTWPGLGFSSFTNIWCTSSYWILVPVNVNKYLLELNIEHWIEYRGTFGRYHS